LRAVDATLSQFPSTSPIRGLICATATFIRVFSKKAEAAASSEKNEVHLYSLTPPAATISLPPFPLGALPTGRYTEKRRGYEYAESR
jgi:hypothetical protein